MHTSSLSLPPRTVLGYRRDGRPIFNIAGGSSPESPPPAPPAPPVPALEATPPAPPAPVPAPPKSDGFPDNTPLTEMSADQREAYWKTQARKHEKTVKDRADYDDLKKQAAEAAQLRKERETETEKALREAREQARAEALAEVTPRLVQARFAAAAAGRIDDERLATLIEDIDLTRFLNAKGDVDVDKIASKVNAWAPLMTQKPNPPKPDGSQGARNTKTSGTDLGREMFEARRPKTRAS